MRTITVNLKDVRRAMQTGKAVAEAWRRKDERWGDWMSEAVEIARIPKVWARMKEAMAEAGYAGIAKSYTEIAPCTDIINQLPGYVLAGWNSGPREGWDYGHSASVVWDGVRRELFPGLVQALMAIARGHTHPSYYEDLERYKVRVTGK